MIYDVWTCFNSKSIWAKDVFTYSFRKNKNILSRNIDVRSSLYLLNWDIIVSLLFAFPNLPDWFKSTPRHSFLFIHPHHPMTHHTSHNAPVQLCQKIWHRFWWWSKGVRRGTSSSPKCSAFISLELYFGRFNFMFSLMTILRNNYSFASRALISHTKVNDVPFCGSTANWFPDDPCITEP